MQNRRFFAFFPLGLAQFHGPTKLSDKGGHEKNQHAMVCQSATSIHQVFFPCSSALASTQFTQMQNYETVILGAFKVYEFDTSWPDRQHTIEHHKKFQCGPSRSLLLDTPKCKNILFYHPTLRQGDCPAWQIPLKQNALEKNLLR